MSTSPGLTTDIINSRINTTEVTPPVAYVAISVILYVIIGLTAAVGNLLVILTIVRTESLRRPTYYLIGGLAGSDLLTALVGLPAAAYGRLIPQDAESCTADTQWRFLVASKYLHAVSVCHLVSISFDRLISIARPLRYVSIVTPRRVGIVAVLLWILSLPFALIPLYEVVDPHGFHCYGGTSHDARSYLSASIIPAIFCVICFVYWFIFRVARKHALRIAALEEVTQSGLQGDVSSQMKATKTTLIVVCAFGFCWLPLSIKFLLEVHLSALPLTMLYMRTTCEIVAFTNAAVNPLVYVYRDQNFRRVFEKMKRMKQNLTQ